MINVIQTLDLENSEQNLDINHLEKGVYRLVSGNHEAIIEVLAIDFEAKSISIRHDHHVYDMEFKNDLDMVMDKMGIQLKSDNLKKDIKAPMPGKVIDIVVQEGDKVEKGDAILILEAMKMENVLKAESDCSIKKVLVASSENVEKNQILVEFDD